MTGLRIRWRREGSDVAPAATPASSSVASGAVTSDVLIWLAVALIVILAFAARAYNVDWDENNHLHPDERFLAIVANDIKLAANPADYFDTAQSKLNPYNRKDGGGSFVYGTLPLFTTKVVAVAFGQDDYDHLALVGRWLSALVSAATVLLVFLVGRRLYGGGAGLLGAFLLATAPLAIQHAHFFVVDPFLTFFTTAVLYYCVRIVQDNRRADYVWAGVALGLAMACKVTALLVAPVIVAAVLLRAGPAFSAWSASPAAPSPATKAALRSVALRLVLAGALAFLAFRIAQPYAFDTPSLSNFGLSLNHRWVQDQKSQSKLLAGDALFPPSVQWIGRSSYVFPLEEMLHWGMAPAFGIAGWLGLLYAAYRLIRFREARHLLPVVFVLGYFGFMGREFSLYMRYFLPLYPVLAVLGGYALVELVRGGSILARRFDRPLLGGIGYGVAVFVLVVSLLAALAYSSIYTRPVTRIDASRWMTANLPNGAKIATESWDDSLPLHLPGAPDKQFRFAELGLYDPDSQEKLIKLITQLNDVDYIAVSSPRLMDSIPRNPITYPVSSRYYDLLAGGALGFHLERTFTSYPGLFGLRFADHAAEESWTSYDHPRVLIYKKDTGFSLTQLVTALGVDRYTDVVLTPKQADRNGLMLSNTDLKTQRAGGTWTDVFSDTGLAHSHPTLLWLLALELGALGVAPMTLLLLRRLPDRGYLLTKPMGLLVLAYPVWLLASLKLVHFDQTSILVSLAALLLVGSLVAYRNQTALAETLRTHWRVMLFSEVLFLVAFFAFRELRLENPDLWHPARGGEKPMDLAYLTAVARSTTFPPYDPWFAGGYINYYYYGQFLTATLIKLTTIPPEVAFNLAVPTFFAMTIGGAFSVSYNLAAASRRLLRRSPGFRPIPSWSPYAAGLLGAFFVGLAGNLDGLDQLSDRLALVSSWHVESSLPLVQAIANGAGGLWQVVAHSASLATFDFWHSSRMLSPTISITEFPFFSFLFADLHAHMMAMPFDILTIGLSLSLVLGRPKERSGWQEWGVVALLGFIVGALRWLNSWDYPTFTALALGAIAIGERRLEGGAIATSKRLVLKAALLLGLSLLLFKPFADAYQTPVSGVHASPEVTPLHQYLAHFGIFLALIAAWLLFLTLRALRRSPLVSLLAPPGKEPYALRPSDRLWLRVVALGIVATAGGFAYLALKGHIFVAALLPFLALVILLALRELSLRRADGGVRLFLLALVALALGLSMGVDLVTINGDINRMNTVFKFYLHAWIFFALVAGFGSWWLLFVVWRPAFNLSFRLLPRAVAVAGGVSLVCLIAAAWIYPIGATPARLHDRFLALPKTLDGEAYMQHAVFDDAKGKINLASDYEGIQWMRHNVKGTPAIVEGHTDLYRWGGRFSIYTGLPAVLGWDWHQKQQRGDLAYQVDQRLKQVDDFYASGDAAQAQRFLRRYGVEYVIVGRVERLYYPAAGLVKFDSNLNGTLEVVFSNPELTIYHVKPTAAASLADASP